MPIARVRPILLRRALLGALAAIAISPWGCTREQPPPNDQAIDLTRPDADPELPLPAPPPKPQWCPKNDGACSAREPADTQPSGLENTEPLDETQRYEVELAPEDPVKGPTLAPVTLVVFSDFQCPFCKRLALTLAELQMQYPTQIRLVWKDLPLPGHAFAGPAALLGREAYARGGSRSFWELHDMLFTRQSELGAETLQTIALRFELPWPPSEQHQVFLDRTYQQVLALNVRSTPTTFVNGMPIIGAQSLDQFERAVDAELQRVSTGGDQPVMGKR
jgi:protein-disulfide isomerase